MASCEWQAINLPSISYSKKVGVQGYKEEDFMSKPGWINNKTGDMIINKDVINAILDYSPSTVEAAIAAVTPLHELTHSAINKEKIFIREGEDLKLVQKAAKGLEDRLQHMLDLGTIKNTELLDKILKRMRGYASSKNVDFSEFLTTYGEAMLLGGIDMGTTFVLPGIKRLLFNAFKKFFPTAASYIDPFKTTEGMVWFLQNHYKKFRGGSDTDIREIKGDKEIEEDLKYIDTQAELIPEAINKSLKEAGFSFSEAFDNVLTQQDAVVIKQAGDQINQNITEKLALSLNKDVSELTKDDWAKQGLADAYMYLIAEQGKGRPMLDNLIRMGLRKGKKMKGPDGLVKYGKNITGNDVYGVPIAPLFLEDVGQQLYRRTIQRFDPAQNDDLGGFVVSELMNFRIAEVVNQYAKRYGKGSEVSQEKVLSQAGDLTLAETLESDELTPEEYTDQQLALEREKKAIKVRQKGKVKEELPKRSIARQDMGTIKSIEEEAKNEIRDMVDGIIDEIIKNPKGISSVDKLVGAIEKKLGDQIIKKLGGTIGMKKGEFVVPQEWLDFVSNEYDTLVKGIPGKLIKKSYQDLYNIKPTGDKVNITSKAGTYQIDTFEIDQPTKEEWINYFARPETAEGKPVSIKNKYIARQRGLAGIVVREMVKNEMEDFLNNPENIKAVAAKLNVPAGQVALAALEDQILNQFNYDVNEQKDNLASIYSFSDTLDDKFTSLSSALNKLTPTERLIFNSYQIPFIQKLNDLYTELSKEFPGQPIQLGMEHIRKAWLETFSPVFLSIKKAENILKAFKDRLNYYTPKWRNPDTTKMEKLSVNQFLYDTLLRIDQDSILKEVLNLGKEALDSNNQQQIEKVINDMAGIMQEALEKQDYQAALETLYFINSTFNQSGRIGRGGMRAVWDNKEEKIKIVQDPSLGTSSLRYSLFAGGKNLVEALGPLFEMYGIKLSAQNLTKDPTKKAKWTINYEFMGLEKETDYVDPIGMREGLGESNLNDIIDSIAQEIKPWVEEVVNYHLTDRSLRNSENYAKTNQDFLLRVGDYFKKAIKEAKTEEDAYKLRNSFGMFLRSANGDMRAPIRAAFRVEGFATNLDPDFIKKYNKAKPQAEKDKLAKDYFRYEHNPPSRTTLIGLGEYVMGNWNKSRVKEMFKAGGISIIPKTMDDVVSLFYKETVPGGYIIGSKDTINKFGRYFNPETWGEFDHELVWYKKVGNKFVRTEEGKGWEKAYKDKQKLLNHNTSLLQPQFSSSKGRKFNATAIKELKNYSKAQANALKYPVENKGISIFDFDDTVAISKSKVIVNFPAYFTRHSTISLKALEKKGYAIETLADYAKLKAQKGWNTRRYNQEMKQWVEENFQALKKYGWSMVYVPGEMTPPPVWGQTKLTPAQFAEQARALEDMGAEFDFSEFNDVVDGRKGPLFTKLQKAINKFGNDNVFILTARPQSAAFPIWQFLNGLGINLKIENIIGLEDGSPGAKANWVAEKAAEGYNDFYFTDDSYANVKAVQDVLDIVDVKGKTHQAQYSFSDTMDRTFNEMIQRKTGIKSDAKYSQAKGKLIGSTKRDDIFITSDADDFQGLMYRTLGKGEQGNKDKKFLEKALYRPFARAMDSLSKDRVNLMADYKKLKKDLGISNTALRNNQIPAGFSEEQAVRIWLWNDAGYIIPGLSQSDIKEATNYINKNPLLSTFVQEIKAIIKDDKYEAPSEAWLVGTISTDLTDLINGTKRQKYLEESGFIQNKDIIFSEPNMAKLEAAFGNTYREALDNILKRMVTGKSRGYSGDSLTGKFMDWINGSVGAIMFFNTRSAVLQTLSAVNYINWTDNNILAASQAFANQPQYWSDFLMLFNSDFLKDRRAGLRINVNEADLAEAARNGGVTGAINHLLKLGFLPTQIMDSFAIASGGATFYRNRLKTYLKTGITQEEANTKALTDWREIAEETQQSARADKISQQQAGPMGRIILAFANTPMQYTRLMKKAALDLANGRGDWRTNVTKLIYYSTVQNFIFNALQNALFALAFGDADDEEEEEKSIRVVNGMLDSILRGTGFYGAGIAAIKNAVMMAMKQSKLKNPKYEDAVFELLNFSPPLGNKAKKIRAWGRTLSWDSKEIREAGFSLDNPALMAYSKLISAATNLPLDRVLQKIENIKHASSTEAEMWQKMALLGGWQDWEVNLEEPKKKKKRKTNYKPRKKIRY